MEVPPPSDNAPLPDSVTATTNNHDIVVDNHDDINFTTESRPCDRVRSTCRAWVTGSNGSSRCEAGGVAVDPTSVQALCDEILEMQQGRQQQHDEPEWDAEGWHYAPPPEWPQHARIERIALYVLALDAVNFCFWPVEGYEYVDLATTLTSIASMDHDMYSNSNNGHDDDDDDDDNDHLLETYALSPSKLANMSVEEMTELFATHHPQSLCPPDMDRRCKLWNEVGTGLLSHYGGYATNLIAEAGGSAQSLVRLLLVHFPGFRDVSVQHGVWFLKRAQICVGDLNAALRLELEGMDRLTTFPDYRVPQLLREHSVLRYGESLSNKVDRMVELEEGGIEECSIRAATVVAVDRVVEELNSRKVKEAEGGEEEEESEGGKNNTKTKDRPWTAVEADWVLWQIGEGRIHSMRPHHRVRTTFY